MEFVVKSFSLSLSSNGHTSIGPMVLTKMVLYNQNPRKVDFGKN